MYEEPDFLEHSLRAIEDEGERAILRDYINVLRYKLTFDIELLASELLRRGARPEDVLVLPETVHGIGAVQKAVLRGT